MREELVTDYSEVRPWPVIESLLRRDGADEDIVRKYKAQYFTDYLEPHPEYQDLLKTSSVRAAGIKNAFLGRAVEPFEADLAAGEKIASAIAEVPGIEKAAEAIQRGTQTGAAGLWRGVAGRLGGIQRYAALTPERGPLEPLVEQARQVALARAAKVEAGVPGGGPEGTGWGIVSGVARAPFDILGMGPEMAILGPAGGMAAYGGGQAYGAGAELPRVALEAGKGYLAGKAIGLAGELPLAARVPAMGAVGAAQAVVEGATPEQIAESSAVMGILGVATGGRGFKDSYRRLRVKGLSEPEAARQALAEAKSPTSAAEAKALAEPVVSPTVEKAGEQIPPAPIGEVPPHIGRAVAQPQEVSVETAVVTKQQAKETLRAAYKNGEIASDSPVRLTTVEELNKIVETGVLAEGVSFEGQPGLSAQLAGADRPIVAYGANDRISAAIVFPKEASLGRGKAPNEVLIDPQTDLGQIRFVVGGNDKLLTFTELAEIARAGKATPPEVAMVSPERPVSPIGEQPPSGEMGAATDPIAAILAPIFGTKQRADAVAIPSQFKEVEQRWTGARGIQSPGLLTRAKIALAKVKNAFTRHFPYIDPKESPGHARAVDILRQQEAVPEWSKVMAFDTVHEITRDLGPKRADLFTRALVLPDILKDVEAGLYQGKDLPFGYKDQASVQSDLTRFNEAIAMPENAPIREALAKREALVRGVVERLVTGGHLDSGVLADPRYYHRQVLLKMQEKPYVGTSAADVRLHKKGFQRERVGGGDFNTRYQEAEFEWLAQAYSILRTKKLQTQLEAAIDISKRLKSEAGIASEGTEREVNWRKLLPKGYVLWQPKEGSVFYKALTIQEKVLDKLVSGEKEFEASDVSEALAIGRRRAEWAIPEGIAKTLDNFRSFDEAPIERLAAGAQSTWKQWKLFNPFGAVKYFINNFSGDSDIAMAYNPRIFKYAPAATRDLWSYQIKRNASPEVAAKMRDLVARRVIGSGFTITEIPDINLEGAFRSLVSDNPNVIQRAALQYWGGVKKFNVFRENMLRLAAYDHFISELTAGKKVYGASRRHEIDAIPDIKDKAAKLASELIGDYGNVSSAGLWLRRHLIPFYSWLEINGPRYIRMVRNLPVEGRGTGAARATRITGAATKHVVTRAAAFAIKANVLFGLVYLWNKTMFPEEEKLLGRSARKKPVLILGKTDDGQIRSVRFEGALADFLDWIALGNYAADIEEVVAGKATVGEKAVEAAKAPVEKIIQSWEPFSKTTFETALGKSTYPRVFEEGASLALRGSPIRDRPGHIARAFSLDSLWNVVTKKPRPRGSISRPDTPKATSGLTALADAVLTYKTDPGEASYYVIRDKASKFLDKIGKGRAGPSDFTDRQNALYYFKKAHQWGDKERANYWLKKYGELGGSQRGLEQSIRLSSPLGMIPKGFRGAFIRSLDKREREVLGLALAWYNKAK